MATNTTNNYFSKPAVGGDTDAWGATLNANWDTVDSVLAGDTNILALSVVPASATDIAATFTGLVGIGTTDPEKKLHVLGGDIRIESHFPRLYLTDSDNDSDFSIINNNGKFSIYDDTNTTYRMAIDSSGKVGIGTTNPLSDLHIYKQTDAKIIIEGDTDNDSGEESALLQFKTDGGIVGHTMGIEQGTDNALVIDAGNGSNTTVSNDLVFKTKPIGTTTTEERMRIDSVGRLLIGGTQVQTPSSIDNGVFIQSQTNEDVVGVNLYVNETSNNRRADFFLDDANGIYGMHSSASTGLPDFVVKSGTDERFRVTNAGNVGIGTTNPATSLHVLNASDTQIRLSQTGEGSYDLGVVDGDKFAINRDGLTNEFVMSAGNVGIGTDDPNEALHVVGNIKIEGASAKLKFSETDANPDWSIINSEGALAFYDDTADTTRMKLDTSGHLRTDTITCLTGQQLVLNVGESSAHATGQTAEALYVNAEAGLQVNSSPNNWGGSGWSERYTTTIGGASGQSVFPTDIYVANRIFHEGDTNTYTQFHAADQWRVVTGGAERLEVNNSAVTTTTQFVGKGAIAYTDVSFVSNTDGDQTVTFSIPSGHAVINALITTSRSTFPHNEIEKLTNSSCVVNRLDTVSGTPTVNLRVWHAKL